MWTWFLAWNVGNVVLTALGLLIIWPWWSTSPDVIACQLAGIGLACTAIVLSFVITRPLVMRGWMEN